MNMLRDAFMQRQEHAANDLIFNATRVGMWPFRYGRADHAVMYDANSMDRVLFVEIDTLPNYPFREKIDDRLMLDDSDSELLRLGNAIVKHFRYRPALPVDDHIVLGEE